MVQWILEILCGFIAQIALLFNALFLCRIYLLYYLNCYLVKNKNGTKTFKYNLYYK